ncbi:MAG: hypothetical protein D6768_17215 [Chloroflexi bacterium]|nr:MAG: hypothetical protein D6768_17215 [Chloroflexota bacterium]
MFRSKKGFSVIIGSGLALLLLVGTLTVVPAFAQGPGGMMGGGFGGGMMGGGMMGNGGFNGTAPGGFTPGWMMNGTQGVTGTTGFGGMMGNLGDFGGMMNGVAGMMSGGFGGGMMGGGMMFSPNNAFYTAPEPLSLDESTTILDAYLADLNDSNLTYQDVMVFDNHTYAQIVEKDTGIGVMEVLVDPTTQAVYPEMGPNMMWNQKYGMMSGYGRYGMMGGMMGMMMGGFNNNMMGDFDNGMMNGLTPGATDTPAEPTVTPEQAAEIAQTWLDTNFSETGLAADEHADPFYGYYTLHVTRNGETAGMLSVNAYSGAVFPHTWHGKLLQMTAEE